MIIHKRIKELVELESQVALLTTENNRFKSINEETHEQMQRWKDRTDELS